MVAPQEVLLVPTLLDSEHTFSSFETIDVNQSYLVIKYNNTGTSTRTGRQNDSYKKKIRCVYYSLHMTLSMSTSFRTCISAALIPSTRSALNSGEALTPYSFSESSDDSSDDAYLFQPCFVEERLTI